MRYKNKVPSVECCTYYLAHFVGPFPDPHPSSPIPHPLSLIPHLSSLIHHSSSLVPHPNKHIPQQNLIPHPSPRVSHFRFLFFFASKRNRNCFASFSLRFAKLKKKIFASFRFLSLQYFRFVSLHFFNFCYNYYLRENGGRREE